MDKCQWEVVEVMHALKKKKEKSLFFVNKNFGFVVIIKLSELSYFK